MKRYFVLFTVLLFMVESSAYTKSKQEYTILLIKPDVVIEKVLYKVISRVEKEDLEIIYMKQIIMNKKQVQHFYHKHKNKPYYHELVNSIANKKIYTLMIEGENAIQKMQDILGNKDPVLAAMGTIRKELGKSTIRNVADSSKSEIDAEDQYRVFFFDVH